jgi:hypothetical protein
VIKVFSLLLFCLLLHQPSPASITNVSIPLFNKPLRTQPAPSVTVYGWNDPIMHVDTPSCVLPFTRAGKLIMLKGRAENTEGNFVLDTGAPYLVLNSTYFRDLEMAHNQDETQHGINGEGGAVQKRAVKQFRLGTFTYFKVEADLVNLGPIENARGVKILGLLGVALFKECEMVIDYEKNEIHLRYIPRKERKTYKNPTLNNPQEYEEHPFLLKDNRIIIQTKLGKKSLQFVVDHAAESNIIDSRLPGSVLDSVQINGRTLLSGTGTKKVEAITGAMSGFTVGSLQVKEMPVIITSLENSCFGNDACINGVLGYDFLSRYKLVFNFVTGKFYVFKRVPSI